MFFFFLDREVQRPFRVQITFPCYLGIPLSGKPTLTACSKLRFFVENKKALVLKIMIFKNSSPRGIMRQIMNNVPK